MVGKAQNGEGKVGAIYLCFGTPADFAA